MSGAEAALEGAILELLRGDPEVTAVLGDPLRVVELGGVRPAYPFLEIGRHVSEPLGGQDAEAAEHRIDLTVMSRDLGGAEAKAALALVRAALTEGEIEMEDWRCVLLVPVFADAMRERPGLWRAMLRLKAIVEPA